MATTQDDAFREIQLNGKQLVFMGMAVVVIAVAIFLMGVQVGRGVRGERGLAEGADVVAAATTTETEPPLPPASVIQGSTETPLTAGEKLSYAERLTGNTEGEALKTDPEPALPAEAPTPKSETPMTAPLPPAPSAAAPTPAPAAPVAPFSVLPNISAAVLLLFSDIALLAAPLPTFSIALAVSPKLLGRALATL